MNFADWVTQDIQECYRSGEAIPLKLVNKLLQSNNPDIKNTWFKISEEIENIRNAPEVAEQRYKQAMYGQQYIIDGKVTDEIPESAWKLFYQTTYEFLISAIHASFSLLPVSYNHLNSQSHVVGALFEISPKDRPANWILNNTYKQRSKPQGEFNKKKLTLQETAGFLLRNEVDIRALSSKRHNHMIFEVERNLGCASTDIRRLKNQLDAEQQSDLISTLSKINDTLGIVLKKVSEVKNIKTTEILNNVSETLDFCSKHNLLRNPRPSLGTANRDNFCYLLSIFFRQHLGGPRHNYVACIAKILFESDMSDEMVAEICSGVHAHGKG